MPATSAAASAGCLAPRDIGVCPCVSFECDQSSLAQLRQVVVHGRAGEPGRLDQVCGAPRAATDEREDLDPLRIGERPAEGDESFLRRAAGRGVVRDEPGEAMLREHQRQPRLEMRDEDDALGLGLGDVAVPARQTLDRSGGRLGAERRPRGRGCLGELGGSARVEQRARPGRDRVGDPVPASPSGRARGVRRATLEHGRRSTAGGRAGEPTRRLHRAPQPRCRRSRRACTTTTHGVRVGGAAARPGPSCRRAPRRWSTLWGCPASSGMPRRLSHTSPSASPTAASASRSSGVSSSRGPRHAPASATSSAYDRPASTATGVVVAAGLCPTLIGHILQIRK